MSNEYYILPNHTGPTYAVAIDEELCIGCNSCTNICRVQTILPNPEKGKPPILAYPDECWYCACCVEACPTGALQMRLPINQRVCFKDKETGQLYRMGADGNPPKSFFLPPYGWLSGNELGGLWKAIERKKKPIIAYVDPRVNTEIGKFFAEKEPKDNGQKITALLKAIGFAKVIQADEAQLDSNVTSVFIGPEPKDADFILSIEQLAQMINRACVSRFTAIDIWRRVTPVPFDEK